MPDYFDSLSDPQKKQLIETSMPAWMSPMLATLTDKYFDDEHWIYERKLDGVRCIVFKSGTEVILKSRNKNKLNATYPELIAPLEKQPCERFISDGEIVAFEGNVTSFSRLQKRINIMNAEEARKRNVEVFLYLFDLMYLDRNKLTNLDLRTRKQLLNEALDFKDPVRFTTHRDKEGIAFREEACKKGWEGIIAKDARSHYLHSRTKKWLKFKCVNQQEFVIGGFTEPSGQRIGFGALLVGFYENGKLRYAGKVGTGFDNKLLKKLSEKLSAIERQFTPFSENNIREKGVHWVEPKLVAEIGFTEWTGDNKLRHPRFLGLRDDKKPGEVKKEKPK